MPLGSSDEHDMQDTSLEEPVGSAVHKTRTMSLEFETINIWEGPRHGVRPHWAALAGQIILELRCH
jgi:hypothetical protein